MRDSNTLSEARINVRIKGPMAEHVERSIGPQGLCENQSEYIRDLIRHDMENSSLNEMTEVLRESNADILAGRIFKSTGNYYEDKKIFEKKGKEWLDLNLD
jgi:antitoxin ParD1/3/4